MSDKKPPDLSDFVDPDLNDTVVLDQVKTALKRRKKFAVDAIADQLDIAPRRVRAAIQTLREHGYRVPAETGGHVEVLKVPPTSDELHRLPMKLLKGERVRFGVVSDTHLCSKECALPELHLAYDSFVEEEIADVFHPGDLVAGLGIFRGQHNELTHHTFEDQVAFAIENYPVREGVTTHIIGGNHDLEGNFGSIGADPVLGVSMQRKDLDYLGPYSAWIELPNGAFMHLLHGKGGMSYAVSYKAQKIVEGYAQGRKPGALLLGHFHVQGNFAPRSVNTMFPACFEWQSMQFGARLGLQPAVGFHIVEAQLADDGTFVEWTPRWRPFIEGRRVGW